MAAYLIATVHITDPDRFAAYAQAMVGMGARYGAQALVHGRVHSVPEGDAPPDERLIVSRFDDLAALEAYIGSDEFLAARRLREGAATVTLRIVLD